MAGCWGPLPTCCGRGCAGVGAQHCPFGLHALRGAACRGGGGTPSRGSAFHRCQERLVSGAVPPPAARPLGRAARAPLPVYPGRSLCWRGDPAAAPQRALLRGGVARCEVGGTASSEGGAPRRCERVPRRSHSPSSGCPSVAGGYGPSLTCCGRRCVGVGVPPVHGAGGPMWVCVVCVVPVRCL